MERYSSLCESEINRRPNVFFCGANCAWSSSQRLKPFGFLFGASARSHVRTFARLRAYFCDLRQLIAITRPATNTLSIERLVNLLTGLIRQASCHGWREVNGTMNDQGRPGSGSIRFKTTFTNTIYEAMKMRGWRETNSDSDWDLIWAER